MISKVFVALLLVTLVKAQADDQGPGLRDAGNERAGNETVTEPPTLNGTETTTVAPSSNDTTTVVNGGSNGNSTNEFEVEDESSTNGTTSNNSTLNNLTLNNSTVPTLPTPTNSTKDDNDEVYDLNGDEDEVVNSTVSSNTTLSSSGSRSDSDGPGVFPVSVDPVGDGGIETNQSFELTTNPSTTNQSITINDGEVPANMREGRRSENEPYISYQDQIYIVSGTLGGILLLLILLVIALGLSVARLKDQVNKKQRYALTDDQNANSSPAKRDQGMAYDNSGFNGHEMQERRPDSRREIEERGYTVYDGKSNDNRRPGNNRDSRSTLMRYEDGVMPITSDRPRDQQRYYGRDHRY